MRPYTDAPRRPSTCGRTPQEARSSRLANHDLRCARPAWRRLAKQYLAAVGRGGGDSAVENRLDRDAVRTPQARGRLFILCVHILLVVRVLGGVVRQRRQGCRKQRRGRANRVSGLGDDPANGLSDAARRMSIVLVYKGL